MRLLDEPTQKLEALVKSRQIEHGWHPILRAYAEAVTVKTDVNENLRPVKDYSGRIDGIVALIMGLPPAPPGRFTLVVLAGAAGEGNLTRERTRFAAVKKANGQCIGAIPYGYVLAPDGSTLIPNEAEQAALADRCA